MHSPVLAIETTTEVCAVALRTSDGSVSKRWISGRGVHSESLFLFIQELLLEAKLSIQDLSAFLVSSGPGSYTGLRIGVSAAKGLLFGQEVPLFQVNTLAALAAGIVDELEADAVVHAVSDARRTHLYHQKFHWDGALMRSGNELDIRSLAEVEALIGSGDHIIGTGIQRLEEQTLLKLQIHPLQKIDATGLFYWWDHYQKDSEKCEEAIIKKVAPEHFEPYYYNSTIPQVQGGH